MRARAAIMAATTGVVATAATANCSDGRGRSHGRNSGDGGNGSNCDGNR